MSDAIDPQPVILVFGGGGQLGRALAELGAARDAGATVRVLDRATADISNADEVERAFAEHHPAAVINAAAYTAVDAAETEEALAFAGNALGPQYLAKSCAAAAVPLFHISTDYVFAGHGTVPWKPEDPVAPVNAYGRSKLAGEWAVRATHPDSYVFRTSWVYGETGKNFVKSMLRLGATRDELSIVSDQHGCPTYAMDLAAALLEIADARIAGRAFSPGIYHFSNQGATTWDRFADAVFEIAARHGYKRPRVNPITSAEYPVPAARPLWSVLDCGSTQREFGITIPAWRDSLERCMVRLMAEQESGS